MSWRVVYGETRPAWERVFATKKEANAFALEHLSFGDIIFSVRRVVPGEPPRSMQASQNLMLGDLFYCCLVDKPKEMQEEIVRILRREIQDLEKRLGEER